MADEAAAKGERVGDSIDGTIVDNQQPRRDIGRDRGRFGAHFIPAPYQ